MSLEKYLAQGGEFSSEIRSEFSREQIEQLCTQLAVLGVSGYLSFLRGHQSEVVIYIGLTPARRAQKKWVNNPDILLIRLAAYQISSTTRLLQNDIGHLASLSQLEVSYRDFHSAASDILLNTMFHRFVYDFPFEVKVNPFLSE